MAVLPWGHSRSRTTSNEKRQNPALEWFSRSGGSEPSRQALSLLIKEHTRSSSAGSMRPQSRSSTAQSHHSQKSHSSQVADINEKNGGHTVLDQPRPTTPQLPLVRPTSPTSSFASALDRFGISSGLKRKSSKMSINSDVVASTTPVVSPSRTGHSRLGFRKKEPPVSPTRSESTTPAISRPFAFQHITHSDQSHFNALSRIDESELASQFGAVRASQSPELTLRGIRATELPLSPHGPSCSPRPCTGGADLPLTPPRPTPPPKDSPQFATQHQQKLPSLEVRMSRSMENFSRPTPRSPASPVSASPKHIKSSRLPYLIEADEPPTGPPAKPLPLLPAIVHAVSTEGDTAQCIKSSHLPLRPHGRTPTGVRRRRKSSSKGVLRHMSTFPSARQAQRFSAAIPESHRVNLREDRDTLPRHKSEDALTKYNKPFTSVLSSDTKKEDWEDAIEYAWDHADDQSIDEGDSSDSTATAVNPKPEASVTLTSQQEQESESLPSTPLMMSPPKLRGLSSPIATDRGMLMPGPSNDDDHQIFGLGIDANPDSPLFLRHASPPALGISIPKHHYDEDNDESYHLPRSTYSAISKSSSQESIILSIASSILGTQRSSNSSVSPSDLSRLSKCDEPASAATSAPSPLLTVDHQKAARPESTCVPISLLQGFAVPSSKGKPNTSIERVPPHEDADDVTPLASDTCTEEKVTDTSTTSSPQRNIALTNRSPRKRSNTQTSASRRNGRASYSLFPSAPA